jgi:hypothetical protein
MIACTPEESQKSVAVMSATTVDMFGARTAMSCWYTCSELVTSISAGSSTTTGMTCAV